MKKIYSIIVLLVAFATGTWADNLIGDNQTFLMSSTPIKQISGLVDGYYILRVNPIDQPTPRYIYTDNNTYTYNNGSNPTNNFVVYVTIKEDNSSTDSPNKKITIKDYNGNYMYIASDATSGNIGTTTEETNATELSVSNTPSTETIRLWLSTNNYLNLNGTPMHIAAGSGGWSQYWFYPVTIIDNPVNVTYKVVNANDASDVWASTTVTQAPNSAISMPSEFNNPLVTLSDPSGTIATDDVTITYKGSIDLLSSSYDNATWYYLKVRENQSNGTTRYIAYNATTTPYPNSTNKTEDFAGQWAFVGSVPDSFNPYNDEISGVKIYNRKTGASQTLKTTTPPTLAEGDEDSEWVLGKNTMGFTFHISGTGKYLHDLNGNLSYWDAAAAKNDGGSAFTIEKTPPATELVASEIEPYYNATGYFALTDAAKQELVAAGYKANETTYTDTEFNSIYDKLTELFADARNVTLPETGYYRIKSSGKASQQTIGYIGLGKSSDNTRGPGLKTITTSYNTDASTVLYLNRTADDANTYTISTQGVWATRATALNQPVLYTTNNDDAGTFTFSPVTNNPNYAGFGTIKQDAKVNDQYDFFHEAGWGTDNSCVCVWEAGTTNTPSFWQVEKVNDGDLVYSTTLHDAGDSRYYATTYLPFPSRITTEGVTAYIGILDDSKTYIHLTEISGTIPANTGVVLVGGSNGSVKFVLSTAENATTTVAENKQIEDNNLNGVNIATTVAADGWLTLGKSDEGVGFYHWSGSLTNKAYLTTSTDASSKGFAFSFGDDDPTGISEDLVKEAVLNLQKPIYNVQGQRVGADYKGIIIQDGKKYLQK